MKKTRIIFFDIKDYDREFFEKYGKNYNYEMSFFKSRLSLENVHLTKGYDVVCAFTNDDIGKETHFVIIIFTILFKKFSIVIFYIKKYNSSFFHNLPPKIILYLIYHNLILSYFLINL